ncbi:CDP-glycerol glycerophosphotransferase family protein [Enterococcus gilvus]|uniref:CDP-glycerol glycerophosphotransferase family protein n=1 Tax=Enterococcus gilvus TaxID=160453 RepID=UPI00290A27C4|nr:CDP-glycerol glycerophosphotransferase family protein [Enterococcus gilvus]MDU5510209.1 CDP-glycerol glycerophosphotransferase family protein [Enterococcus gilvus]
MELKLKLIRTVFLRIFDYSIFYLCYPIFIFFPVKKNKIVVSNFWGKSYGENPKYIVNYLLENFSNLDIVWLCKTEVIENKRTEFPSEVRLIENNSFKALLELHTAKIWIDNCRKNFHPKKRKNQFYIQTWHAGFGLKRIEHDIESSLSKRYVRIAKKDSQMCDLLVFEHSSLFRNLQYTFWYSGEFYRNGIPKNDIIVKNDLSVIEKVYSYYEIDKQKKILLYAPTFREDGSLKIQPEVLKNIKETSEAKFKNEIIILLRLHPNDVKKHAPLINELTQIDYIINANDYPDTQELLCALEILITDYSSIFGEMLVSKKKCFLYAYDYDEYMKSRGLVLELEDLPFPVSKNSNQLIQQIRTFDEQDYFTSIERFNKRLGIFESGMASKELGDRIIMEMDN